MKTKKIDISEYWIDDEGKPLEGIPEVIVRRMGYGEKNDLIDEVSNLEIPISKQTKNINIHAKPLYGKLQTLTLLKCIVSAPFPIEYEYIHKTLDPDLGDMIFEIIDDFNVPSNKKKRILEVVGEESE